VIKRRPGRHLVVGACLGVLLGFLAWALWWTLGSLEGKTFGMRGDVTTLYMTTTVAQPPDDAGDRLAQFLEQDPMSVVVEPPGEGPPGLLAWDPTGVIDWLPRSVTEDSDRRGPRSWLFADTYSADLWGRGETPPLLPRGTEVSGVIPTLPEEGAESDLQYVAPLSDFRPVAGTYVLSTTDPIRVLRLERALRFYGLESRSVTTQSVAEYFKRQPLLIATVTMIGLGLVCAVVFWVLMWRTRSVETGLRAKHGATVGTLAARLWLQEVGPLLVGLVAGSVVAIVGAAVVGRAPPTAELWVTVGSVLVVGGIGCSLLLAIVAWLTLRVRYDADVAA